MWRASLVLASVLLAPAAPDYVRLELHELVAGAQRIVCGSITAVQDKTFDLAVERDLAGQGAPTLHLERFFDWTCAARWAHYEVGQRVVLFLDGGRAMGAGDEGDWPVVDGAAFAPYRIHGLEPDARADGTSRGTPLMLDELAAAVRGHRAAFRAHPAGIGGRRELRLGFAVDEFTALAYSKSSRLALHLFEETTSARAFDAEFVAPGPPPLQVEPILRARADGFSPPPGPEVTWTPRWDSDFGKAIAATGDVNGDGWDDLAARGDTPTLWILFLDAKGRVQERRELTPDALGISDEYFAESLAAAGDLDQDGIPDLAVGAPSREHESSGQVWLLHLERDGSVKKAQALDAPRGAGPMPGFGAELATLGDLDRDGTVDLLVNVNPMFAGLGALFARGGPPPAHRLWCCFLGGEGARATSLLARDFTGSDNTVTLGDAVVGLGDLDGDGLAEFALGFPYADDGGEERGAVWIAHPQRDGSLRAKEKISDWSESFPGTLRNGDHFGQCLAAPGDLDGDGIADLIVGGERELWLVLLQRDGTVKDSRQFGARSGGFVPAEQIRDMAVLRGPEGALRLAVSGTRGHGSPLEAVIWVFGLGPGASLRAL